MSVHAAYHDALEDRYAKRQREEELLARIERLAWKIAFIEGYVYDCKHSSHRFWRAQNPLNMRTVQWEQAKHELDVLRNPPLDMREEWRRDDMRQRLEDLRPELAIYRRTE